jgi:hypothetical protein
MWRSTTLSPANRSFTGQVGDSGDMGNIIGSRLTRTVDGRAEVGGGSVHGPTGVREGSASPGPSRFRATDGDQA